MSRFFRFLIQTKNQPHHPINHARFSKSAKFHENPLQMHGNMGPQNCQCLQNMYARGQALASGHTFAFRFKKLACWGSHISMSLQRIPMKLCSFTKLHMINGSTEVVFIYMKIRKIVDIA